MWLCCQPVEGLWGHLSEAPQVLSPIVSIVHGCSATVPPSYVYEGFRMPQPLFKSIQESGTVARKVEIYLSTVAVVTNTAALILSGIIANTLSVEGR